MQAMTEFGPNFRHFLINKSCPNMAKNICSIQILFGTSFGSKLYPSIMLPITLQISACECQGAASLMVIAKSSSERHHNFNDVWRHRHHHHLASSSSSSIVINDDICHRHHHLSSSSSSFFHHFSHHFDL